MQGSQGVENLTPASSGVGETNCLQGKRTLPCKRFWLQSNLSKMAPTGTKFTGHCGVEAIDGRLK